MFIFRAWSSILSGVESGKTERQGRKVETLKKMVHLPYLYHFLSVDFKHFSWLKIYRVFFENICHDSFNTGSPNFSPVLHPLSFRGVLITSFLQSMMRWLKHAHLSFAGARSQKSTKLYHSWPGQTLNQTSLHSEHRSMTTGFDM